MKDVQLVSVVIPCYNVEAYIEECLASVFRQTYSKLEVICIDNNSTDRTFNILLSLRHTYPQLIVEKEHQPGASAARNKGLAMATSEWVQFLDADDLLAPQKLAHQVSIVKAKPACGLVVGSSTKLLINGTSVSTIATPMNEWQALVCGKLGNTCANLFKKDKLVSVKGWDTTLMSSQETNLMFRLLQNGVKVCFDDQPLTIIRARESGSISQINLEENLVRYIMVRAQVLEHINAHPEIGVHVKETVLQILFDRIRELYIYNPKRSIQLYNQIIPKDFRPTTSQATTKGFLITHNLFGFKNAQLLKKFLK